MTRPKYDYRQRQMVLPGTTVGGEVGTFSVDFIVRNWTDTTREISLNGLVDTGASFTVIPARILDDLGIERERYMVFEIADGSKQQLPLGWVEMELLGQSGNVYVVFGHDSGPILLGAMALETFSLAADARNRTLIPAQSTL